MQETVTLLHGFTLCGESWNEMRWKLEPAWRVIAPDARGHGSAWVAQGEPCTMDGCAADLVALWDHLGIEQSHVVGYSMGGRLGLHVAVRLPDRVRSLLTIGAHAGLEPDAREARRRSDESLAERIEHEGLEWFVRYWESLPMFAGIARRGPDFAAWLHALRLRNEPSGLAASLRGMGAGAMEPLWDDLAAIACPSTFVAGDRDASFIDAARRMTALVPASRLQTVRDSGHAAPFEQPDETAAVVADHLRWATSGVSSSTGD